MRTKIISAFPGTGKSYYHMNHPDTTVDSDSMNFSWVFNREGEQFRNPEFPKNYIDHIKSLIGRYEYIFVSSHDIVRNALLDECIFFYLLFPPREEKEVYIEKYKARGSNQVFIDAVAENWDKWMDQLEDLTDGDEDGCCVIELEPGDTLTDILDYVL